MPSYFLDSSALVKGYRNEIGTSRINELLRGPNPLIITVLGHLEVASAIVRRAASSGISDQDVGRLLQELDREVKTSFDVIRIDDAVLASANRLTRIYHLRAADAIQLATASLARDQRLGQQLVFLSADDELNSAAIAERFQVENPNS